MSSLSTEIYFLTLYFHVINRVYQKCKTNVNLRLHTNAEVEELRRVFVKSEILKIAYSIAW